jgi:ATP phosphoribosyltransferase
MLRIAVPNKGSLADTAAEMLAEAGYTGRRDPKDLHVIDPVNEVEFFYLRPKDIATYVGSGALDVGITGRDLLLDARMPGAREIESSASAARRSASRPSRPFPRHQRSRGPPGRDRLPGLVDGFLDEQGVAVDLVPLDGAVESAVQLGVADAVADVVSTGTTLRQAGLEIFGPVLLESEAVLIGAPVEADGTETLLRRLRGVMVARRYVLIDYDLPADLVDEAVALAPGIESPTISPLRDPRGSRCAS